MVTGSDRMTPDMKNLPHLGEAPELNEFTAKSFKANLATFTTGDDREIQKIFKKQYGGDVSFRKDKKGNIIVKFPSGEYPINKPGLSPQDIPKFFGDLAAFNPAARASTIRAAVVKSALGESVLEGVDASLGGDFSPQDVGMSAVLGGGFKALEDAASLGSRAILGNKTQQAEELLSAGKQFDTPILTSDALPPENIVSKLAVQTGEKIPFAGTGAMRAEQQLKREKPVNEFIDRYGQFSYKSIVDSLRASKDKVKRAAGNVMGQVGEKLDDVGAIPIRNTKDAIANAQLEFSKPGVIQSTGAMEDLGTLIKAIDEAPQTFSTLKENRTAFREIVKSTDKAERSQLTSRAKSMLSKVEEGITNDMKSFAKDNLSRQQFKQWNRANKIYFDEAIKMTKTKIKNVLDVGDVTPEVVEKMLFSKYKSELKNLYSSLDPAGRKNARSAIISKVASATARREKGTTPNSFATELKKYNEHIDVFFKGEEKKQLKGLQLLLDSTKRAQDAAAATPTGQGNIGGGVVASVVANAFKAVFTGGTLGSIARAYESTPVRNALLNLAGTRRGTAAFDKALQEAMHKIKLSAQTINTQEANNG